MCGGCVNGRARAEDVKRENSRLELGLSDQDLEQMMIQAQRGRKREEAGTWALAEEEEENVERRKAALARRAAEAEENPEEAEVAPSKTEEGDAAGLTRMAGVRIRRAKLRSVNRDQMKARPSPCDPKKCDRRRRREV